MVTIHKKSCANWLTADRLNLASAQPLWQDVGDKMFPSQSGTKETRTVSIYIKSFLDFSFITTHTRLVKTTTTIKYKTGHPEGCTRSWSLKYAFKTAPSFGIS